MRADRRATRPVFLDLKLHDIPNTVERASRNSRELGVAMFTVHALGGEAMVAAAVRGAREGAEAAGVPPPLLVLAVTVLSSLSGEELASPGVPRVRGDVGGRDGVVVSGEDVRDRPRGRRRRTSLSSFPASGPPARTVTIRCAC